MNLNVRRDIESMQIFLNVSYGVYQIFWKNIRMMNTETPVHLIPKMIAKEPGTSSEETPICIRMSTEQGVHVGITHWQLHLDMSWQVTKSGSRACY